MGWEQEVARYREAGFSDTDIQNEEQRRRKQYFDAGFSVNEIDAAFGVKQFDPTALKEHFAKSLPQPAENPQGVKEADSFISALEAGFQMSVSGLMARGEAPNVQLSRNAGMAYRIASQIGTLAGDIPAMFAGGVGGGIAGSEVPIVGNVIGAGIGSFALPAALRKIMMDHYEKGDVKSFSDFWERTSATFIESAKAGIVGGATSGVGGVAGKAFAPIVGEALTPAAKTLSEIGTMVTVGSALEGEMPEPTHFLEAAILVGGLHGVSKASAPIAKTLRQTFADTGLTPWKVVEEVDNNPHLKEQFNAKNPDQAKINEILTGEKGPSTEEKLAAQAKLAEGQVSVGSYEYVPIDVNQPTEGKQFYHGTKSDLSSLSSAEITAFSSVKNLYGEGLYLTDNPAIARSYAENKGKGPSGKVLGAKLGNLKLIDLDQPVPQDALNVFNDLLGSITKTFDAPVRMSPKAKGRSIYEAIKGSMSDAGYTHTDATEIWQQLNSQLSELGYDGLKHEGGHVAGKLKDLGKHNVVIVFPDSEGKVGLGKLQDIPVTPTPPSEPPALNPDESVKMMMDQIGERTAKVKKPYTFDQFYTDFVDKFNPIKQAVNLMVTDPKALLDNENPYSLARMVNDYKAKVKYIYEKGAYDFQTLGKIKDAPVFKDIVDKHRDSIHEFNAYLISARGLELMKRSGEAAIENIFSSDPAKEAQLRAAAKATVEKLSGKYAESAKQLVELQNHNLKILKDSGRISQEQFDAMVEANKSYIPFKRLLEIESDTGGKKQGKGFLKQITGASEGAEKIQNPLVSILDNTETVVRLSEMNRASLALVKMFESSGTDLAEKLPNQLKATEVSKEEMLRYFKKNNIDATPEAMTVFRQSQKYNLAENQFEVYRDGKREVWQTKDPELAKAINALGGDPAASNVIIKLFRGVTAIKKLGISLTPEFIARNFLRDQLTAQAFSKNPSWKPQIVDTVVAIGDILGKKDSYYQFLKSGGAGGAFIETSKLIDRNLFELNKEVGFIDQVRNQVRKSVDFVEAGARLVEEATRLAEHKRVVGGAESGPKLFEGGMASREITVDFQRIGAKMSAFNAITAFQNVSIQGLDRTIRAIKENPKSMASGVSMITGISVMLWAANKDEKWYQELPRWEKDLFWHIKAGDVVYRFPKPQELGVMFGSLPERILEAWHETESMTSPIPAKAISGFGETLGGLIMPSFIPDAMTPALEQFTNKSFFTGQPIVPQRVESLLPEFQAMEYTSKTAQALGKLVGNVPFVKDIGAKDTKLASPMVIENYIRSWGGTLGTYALQVADKAQEASGVARNVISGNYEMSIQGGKDLFVASLSDVPVIKAFVSRYPNASTQSIKDFRERFQESQRVFNTLRTLDKAGRLDEYTDVMNRHSGDMVKLNGINESISKMGQYIQLVNQTNYSKSDKLNLINSVYHQMIDMARTGNDMIEQFDKAMRASKKRSRLIP